MNRKSRESLFFILLNTTEGDIREFLETQCKFSKEESKEWAKLSEKIVKNFNSL